MLEASLACTACPRLVAYLSQARGAHPAWHNRPVGRFGPADAALWVVGLAPGLRGANRTGRPFCGDESGRWVYAALHRHGFAADATPGGPLIGAAITNAVRCVPPGNKPLASEIHTCRERWLGPDLAASPARALIALGRVAFASLCALAAPSARPAFTHGGAWRLPLGGQDRWLLASYHPSPLNTRTGRLAQDAFDAVFARARGILAGSA